VRAVAKKLLQPKTPRASDIKYFEDGSRTYHLKTKVWEGKVAQRCSENKECVISTCRLEEQRHFMVLFNPVQASELAKDNRLISEEDSISLDTTALPRRSRAIVSSWNHSFAS
jgi:hypothetical protein